MQHYMEPNEQNIDPKKIISTFNTEKPQVSAGELTHTGKQGVSVFSSLAITELQSDWVDTPEFHKHIHEKFCAKVNEDQQLKYYRDYIEAGAWGFGERSFVWMWKMLLDALPKEPMLMEIGVHRGAILALWGLLRSDATRLGISPMDGAGLPGLEGHDFEEDIMLLHDHFNLSYPALFKGLSTDPDVIGKHHHLFGIESEFSKRDTYRKFFIKDQALQARTKLDTLYIDGSHQYADVKSDIINYSPLVKVGGFMILDDACNDLHMPWGYFQGIEDVTRAVKEVMDGNEQWEFLFNVVHNRVYRKRYE